MYDIITIGSATVDVFAKTKFSELVKVYEGKKETDLLAYPTGSKILIEELDTTTGGGGTNTAVAFSRMGFKVAWLGKLGDDSNGDMIVRKLKEEKVASLAVKGKGSSGYSIILDSIEHDRTILAFKSINNDLRYKEIPLKKLNARWFYFSAMMNESFKSLVKLAKYADKKGIKFAFNPSSYLAKKGPRYLKDILKRAHVLVLNKEEAGMLAKGDGVKEIVKGLLKLGPKIVCVTDGKRGAWASDGEFFHTIKCNEIKPLETTGAGDAFASGFVSAIIKKNDIDLALKIGQANGESVIQYHGAKNKLLKYNEALKIIRGQETSKARLK